MTARVFVFRTPQLHAHLEHHYSRANSLAGDQLHAEDESTSSVANPKENLNVGGPELRLGEALVDASTYNL